MKIKGWAVFSGCYVNGLGNSRVHRSAWNTLSSAKYFMPSTCCIVLNELWGEMVIYHAKFSKEMLIQICTRIHTQETNTLSLRIPYILFFFSSSCIAITTLHFQGEYFSPGEKQTQVRARIRGQRGVFKETFPLFASPLDTGILIWAGSAW